MIKGGGLKRVPCAEDEDFIQALDKMMLENLQVLVIFNWLIYSCATERVRVRVWRICHIYI